MKWDEIEGWFSNLDAEFVFGVCNTLRPGIAVELGVFAGRSTSVMAPICRNRRLTYNAVDDFIGGTQEASSASVAHRTRDVKSLFLENMKKMHLGDYVKLIHADSSSTAKLFDDNSVEFCFVDADHSPDGVRKDLDFWWPKIIKGGILGGHDYRADVPNHPVRKAIDRFVSENNLKIFDKKGSCWGIRKL